MRLSLEARRPRAALADSLDLGYYRSPLRGIILRLRRRLFAVKANQEENDAATVFLDALLVAGNCAHFGFEIAP